jgi:hypothetical protein
LNWLSSDFINGKRVPTFLAAFPRSGRARLVHNKKWISELLEAYPPS